MQHLEPSDPEFQFSIRKMFALTFVSAVLITINNAVPFYLTVSIPISLGTLMGYWVSGNSSGGVLGMLSAISWCLLLSAFALPFLLAFRNTFSPENLNLMVILFFMAVSIAAGLLGGRMNLH